MSGSNIKYVGAIDQGTTSTRFVLIDREGTAVGSHQLEHRQIYPEPGWVEHDPLEIWACTEKVIRETLRSTGADLRQIAANSGHEGAIVVQKVAAKTGSFGFNALTEVYEDLVKAGITDAAKVSRTAMENGASIASLLLTTEALVAEIPEEKPPAPAGPPGGDMY